ncbi:MAG: ABC transporter ATP-binding protein [Fusobacteriota bacterium]
MIELKNINIKYQDKQVLNNFNMKIKKGEKILLKGPSGTGKSTILKVILGFKEPDSGKVFYDNVLVDDENIWEIREKLSYISQGVDFPNMNVLEIIKEIFNYKVNKNIDLNKQNLYTELEKYKLERTILQKNIKNLSGGERQRMAIIISRLLDKKVYLLDEITSALDPELKEIVADNIIKSCKTIIAISHDDVFQKRDEFRIINLERS